MLTAAPERLGDALSTLSVRIDVASVLVRLALTYVAEEQGWRVCEGTHNCCRCVVVSDRRPNRDGSVDVLISRDTPSDCQQALDAIMDGRARTVVLWDEPISLAAAIEALQQRAAVIPERVIRLAHDAPRLNMRQRRALTLVAAGRSNAEISSALHQSSSTTKRDIAELLEIFDAANRAGLTTTAARLGFL